MISMKMPTMKNIDHSGRAIIGSVATTYHPATGSTENVEKLLESIYKELCAKNPSVNVSLPEQDAPIVNIRQPDIPIVNEVKIHQESQPVTIEVKADNRLSFLNLGIAILALAVSIYSLRR